jgi:hypothetical protein
MITTPPLSFFDLPIYLKLFETPNRMITGDALQTHSVNTAKRLLDDNWLIPTDKMLSIDIDGKMQSVIWQPETQVHQYLSSLLGWVSVPSERLKRYKVNMRQCTFWLLKLFNVSQSSRAVMMFDDVLSYLGETRIGSNNVNIYLCSRLENIKNRSAITRILKLEAARGPGVVICSRLGHIPLNIPENMKVVTFESLMKRGAKYCQVDRPVLEGLFHSDHYSYSRQSKLSFSEDYRIVYWHNQRYDLTPKQAAIVEALDKMGGRAHKHFLQAQANTNSDIYRIMRHRVGDKWVPHPLWGTLIVTEGNGYYHFDDEAYPSCQVSLFDSDN